MFVEDRPRPLTGYTNYDQDGPVSTLYTQQLLNYELAAPGTQIMSTIPGGGYATLTGTSMSTPLVAGGLALYNEIKPEDSKELLFGNLINASPFSGQDVATGIPIHKLHQFLQFQETQLMDKMVTVFYNLERL